VAMQVQVKSRQIMLLVSRVVYSRILYAISHPVLIRSAAGRYCTLTMVVSRGLNFPSRFSATFDDFQREIREFPPSIFYLVTAFVINPINNVCLYGISVPICTMPNTVRRIHLALIPRLADSLRFYTAAHLIS
jgi:hypothetical protein